MKSKRLMGILVVLLFAFIAEAYFQRRPLISNILFLLPPILAVLSGMYTIQTYKLSNDHGKVTALITAGLAFWFVGELLFFLFQFVFHIDPFPSVADFFYLTGYPIIFIGLIKEIRIHKVTWKDYNKFYLTLMVLFLVLLGIGVARNGIYLNYKSGDPFINNTIAMAYGVVDFILIIPSLFILKIALDYRGGKLYNSWILILAAMMFMLVGDVLFAIFKDKYADLIWPYTLIDLSWVVSYLLFAYSFFYTAATIKELHTKLIKR